MLEFPVEEIFESIQGEARNAGVATTFIRLFGCNMRCTYCDTGYYSDEAIKQKKWWRMTVEEIIDKVKSFGHVNVCLTGGEPLIHNGIYYLVHSLDDLGFKVEIETNGGILLKQPFERPMFSHMRYIMDIKTPSSGMVHKNKMENLRRLTSADDVVFVISNREDYEFARNIILDFHKTYYGKYPPQFFLSPVNPSGFVDKETSEDAHMFVPQRLMEDRLPNTRMQIQLHKVLQLP